MAVQRISRKSKIFHRRVRRESEVQQEPLNPEFVKAELLGALGVLGG